MAHAAELLIPVEDVFLGIDDLFPAVEDCGSFFRCGDHMGDAGVGATDRIEAITGIGIDAFRGDCFIALGKANAVGTWGVELQVVEVGTIIAKHGANPYFPL